MLGNLSESLTIQRALLHIITLVANEPMSYSTCTITTAQFDFDLTISEFPNYQTECSASRAAFVADLITGVDLGCSLFVVSEDCILPYLDAFYDVHDYAVNRVEVKKMLAVLSSENLVESLLKNDVILDSIPHTLLMVAENDSIDLWNVHLNANNDEKIHPSNRFLFEKWELDKNEPLLPVIWDLKGRVLKMAGVSYPPYSAYYFVGSGEGNGFFVKENETVEVYLDGFEFIHCLEFCRHFNCTVEFRTDDVYMWGDTFKNHTGTGILGQAISRETDVVLGAIYRWEDVFEFTTYSKTMQQAAVKYLVPRPHLLPYYETPILPFGPLIWLCLLGAYVVNALSLYTFEFCQLKILKIQSGNDHRRKGLSYAIMSTVRSVVFEGTRFDPVLLSEFVLFTVLLCFSLLVGNLYSGCLAEVMTIPRYDGIIDTVSSLLQSNLIWGGITTDFFFAIQHTEQPLLRQMIDGYQLYNSSECNRRLKNYELALIVENAQFGNTAIYDFVDVETSRNLMVMAEDTYVDQSLLVSRKTYPFMYLMDNIILIQRQSGIGQFWENNSTQYTMDNRIQKNLHREIDREAAIVALKVEHVLGAIFLLGCGYVAAFVVFILETLAAKGELLKLKQWFLSLK